jgi:uncharacterized protein
MASTMLRCRVVPSIDQIDRVAWDQLDHGASPFLRHGFLTALEASGSIGARSGWQPRYVLLEDRGRLLGAVAAFVKQHSYGEYIFDWSWAGAAERAGLDYYPKLVIAAPITPASGHRILLAPDADVVAATAELAAAVRTLADECGCSSIHWLFCTEDEQARLAALGFLPRASFQFHWHAKGDTCFDDFLGRMASRKRKQIRKERARVHAAIDGVRWIRGDQLSTAQLDAIDRWYRSTTEEHGGHDYLRPGFFHRVAAELPELTWLAQVDVGGRAAAGALFFETAGGLYGRYWGSDVQLDCLHFETAYYAGIDRCIARGLPLFEAGAQGEHKLLRGFEPSPTYSAHWLRHPGLHAAIGDFVEREAGAVARQMQQLAEHGPYRRGDSD